MAIEAVFENYVWHRLANSRLPQGLLAAKATLRGMFLALKDEDGFEGHSSSVRAAYDEADRHQGIVFLLTLADSVLLPHNQVMQMSAWIKLMDQPTHNVSLYDLWNSYLNTGNNVGMSIPEIHRG
jgi:hypothetical protein